MSTHNLSLRGRAISWWFGKEAQSAIPALDEAAAKDLDGFCKQLAGQALRSIREESEGVGKR